MKISFEAGPEKSVAHPFFYQYLKKEVIELAEKYRQHSFTVVGFDDLPPSSPANISLAIPGEVKKTWVSKLFQKQASVDDLRIETFDPVRPSAPGSVLIIPDLAFLFLPESFSKKTLALYDKRLKQSIKNARAVIVPSLYYIQLLSARYQLPREKLFQLKLKPPVIAPELTWEEKSVIQEKYTQGKEYFLFSGDLHRKFDLLTLLKAFSIFKKWQKSNMQLVIAGDDTPGMPISEAVLATYKYKADVVLLSNPSTTTFKQLMQAAYAFIYPALYDSFPLPVLQAIGSGVPVIASAIPEIKELAGNAVIYTDVNEAALSSTMQKIYKDETWRKGIIAKGTIQLQQSQRDAPFIDSGFIPNELIAK